MFHTSALVPRTGRERIPCSSLHTHPMGYKSQKVVLFTQLVKFTLPLDHTFKYARYSRYLYFSCGAQDRRRTNTSSLHAHPMGSKSQNVVLFTYPVNLPLFPLPLDHTFKYARYPIGILDCDVPTVVGEILSDSVAFKTQSGEESSSSGRFNPVGCLQQLGCLGS